MPPSPEDWKHPWFLPIILLGCVVDLIVFRWVYSFPWENTICLSVFSWWSFLVVVLGGARP